jgi:hypothetical protein
LIFAQSHLKKDIKMTALSNLSTGVPFTQLSFVFPETEDQNTQTTRRTGTASEIVEAAAARLAVRPRTIPVGIAAPVERKKAAPAATSSASTAPRRNRPEHISDLLLVVLDRYGIDANEFMAGLE